MGGIFITAKLVYGFFVCFIALNCFQKFVSGSGTLAIDEVEALREIAKQVGKTNWDFNVDPCTGRGNWTAPNDAIGSTSLVSCSCPGNATCHVVSIALLGENLQGVLPPDLYRLRSLEKIDLSLNFLSGSIPPQWATMRLRELIVMGNRLSGPFPEVVIRITTLRYLSIEGNRFTGSIPPELGDLTNLEELILSANEFIGELPKTLAKLTKLKDLRISSNNFSGKIPDFISAWTQMNLLHIQGCSFQGPIPSTISALTSLSDLRISDINEGESLFPQLRNMKSMTRLILRNCSIYGSIPDYIGEMDSLKTLDVSFNNLTGTVPSSFVNLANSNLMQNMYLTGNMLNGSIPSWILDSTKSIDISYNNFTLEDSSQCSQGRANLVESYSSTVDKISGDPSCLQNFPCLAPNKANHHSLYINCGGKEATIGGHTKYEADMVAGGSSTFYSKKHWAFSSTGNFMETGVDQDNYIETNKSALSNISIPELELYTTARISPLSLTYYGLCLMNGNYTVKLYFAEIVFTNDNKFSSLGKRIFNVVIQGKVVLKDFNIEDEARGPGKSVVKFFTTVVTNHTLEIQFYWAGKGTTAIPRRGVYGPLISAISVHPNFHIPSNVRKTVKITLEVLGSVLFLILLVCGILWRLGCLGGKFSKDEDPLSLNLKTGSFTFRQIQAATKNFDSANKIGEGGFGSVYKGLLLDGTVIAVKLLSAKSKQGNREFLNEIGIISTLQHPNLVKLYGCCIEGKQLMLIYEYMENNCLARALFGQDAQSRLKLDWSTRHKICLGIARGLAYLHEESMVKIVHRDIKASNVLLDKDLNAKISDFGLAKLDEEDQSHISTRVAGTIGYMAPEYAIRGYLTYKADVYSFGVVALEIVSGISNASYRPREEFEYLLDWAYLLHGRGCLLELVDPNLGSNFSKKEAMVMLNVALLCTNTSSTLRPTMSEVVSMLEGRTPLSGPAISSIQPSHQEAIKNFWQGPTDSPSISVHTPSSASSMSAAYKE